MEEGSKKGREEGCADYHVIHMDHVFTMSARFF